ncbi:hypothetical protein CHS0354_025816 [Potamilus streckersoni]|uniref:RING-type domain-containing protein n=1 Tax=Potamilus streckersoni TaxID=2493646 RepID=A0AAE0W7A4_9BIVA|nr:hypothetical protein CHS0354_025816 [Potamilus streckersoni]
MAEGNPTCSICLEIFEDPVTIPCNHVFCRGCLERHKEKNEIEGRFACPLCNRVVISCVKKEETNQRYVSKEGLAAKCDIGGPKIPATSRCLECEENYCQVCSATHLKMKALRNHTLRELSVLDQQEHITLHSRKFCTKHPEEEVKIVCKTCKNIPLCLFCKISEHDNHTSRILAEELAEIKNTLEKTRTLCAVRLEQLQICTKDAEAFDIKIDKFEQEEFLSINKQEQELICLLEKKILNIKQEAQKFRECIRIIYEKIRMENDHCKKQLTKEFSDCVNINTEVRKLTATEDEFHVLQRGWYLREIFLEESKRTVKFKLLDIKCTAFDPEGCSMQNLKLTIGKICPDIMREKKINNFLKSCVKGQPLQLLQVKDYQTFNELEQLVIGKYGRTSRKTVTFQV